MGREDTACSCLHPLFMVPWGSLLGGQDTVKDAHRLKTTRRGLEKPVLGQPIKAEVYERMQFSKELHPWK